MVEITTILISIPAAIIASFSILVYLLIATVGYTGYTIYRQPLYLPLFVAVVWSLYHSSIPAASVASLRHCFPAAFKGMN